MLKRVVLFFILTLYLGLSNSQVYIINDPFLKAYESVLLFDKKNARKIIQSETSNEGRVQNLLMFYLDSQIDFIEAILSETNASRKVWNNNFKKRESAFLSGNKHSPFHQYCIAYLYLQKGLIGLKHLDYLQAGMDIRKAFRMFQRNHEKFPDFYFQYKELGLLNCFAGNIPEQFQWLTGLAGMKGNLKTGEAQLKKLIDLSYTRKDLAFLQLEALLYYSTVINVLYNDPELSRTLTAYLTRIPFKLRTSPLYIYLSANIYTHTGNNETALREISRYKAENYSIRFDYLNYFHGLLLLNKAKPEAKQYFSAFIKNFEGIHFIKSAYQKIAWCWLLEENRQQYDLYMSMARNAGRAANDADKQALLEAGNEHIPHAGLLKARLLSDGGYYDEAMAVLQLLDKDDVCTIHRNCVEMNYREARILHLKKQTDEAVKMYEIVIETGKNDPAYFAANSALMLGMIYEEKKDFSSAGKYYRMCLNMPFTEYRNSIQQKAKAGLQRVG